MNGNINVNDTHKARFLIGSVIHIQNIDLTISQSMTDCRRSTFTHHILPHKWTNPYPVKRVPQLSAQQTTCKQSQVCASLQLQAPPPCVPGDSLLGDAICGSDISPVWSQHSPRSQSTTSMIYSISNRMYLKKEK